MEGKVGGGTQEHDGLIYIVHRQLGNAALEGFAGGRRLAAGLIAQARDDGEQMVEPHLEMGARTARGD